MVKEKKKLEISTDIGTKCYVFRKAVIFVSIEHDQDVGNPLEDMDEMGRIYSRNSRHINHKSEEELERIMQENPDYVALSYFEHGLCMWDVQGGERIKACADMRWDGVTFAGIWVPDEGLKGYCKDLDPGARRKKMEEYADQACEVYTPWCNGLCYQFDAKAYKPLREIEDPGDEDRCVFERIGKLLDEESCGGFIGSDHLESGLKDHLRPFLEHYEG